MPPRAQAASAQTAPTDDDSIIAPLFSGGDNRPPVLLEELKAVRLYRVKPDKYGKNVRRSLNRKEQEVFNRNFKADETTTEHIGAWLGDGVYFAEPVGHRNNVLKGGWQFICGNGDDEDEEDDDEGDGDEPQPMHGVPHGPLGMPGQPMPYGMGFPAPPPQPGPLEMLKATEDIAEKRAAEARAQSREMIGLLKDINPNASASARETATGEQVRVLREENADLRAQLKDLERATRERERADQTRHDDEIRALKREIDDLKRQGSDDRRRLEQERDEIKRRGEGDLADARRRADDALAELRRRADDALGDLKKKLEDEHQSREKRLARDWEERERRLQDEIERSRQTFDRIDREVVSDRKAQDEQIRKLQVEKLESTQETIRLKSELAAAKSDLDRAKRELERAEKKADELEEDLEEAEEDLKKSKGGTDLSPAGILAMVSRNLETVGPMLLELIKNRGTGPVVEAPAPQGPQPVSPEAAQHGAPPPRQMGNAGAEPEADEGLEDERYTPPPAHAAAAPRQPPAAAARPRVVSQPATAPAAPAEPPPPAPRPKPVLVDGEWVLPGATTAAAAADSPPAAGGPEGVPRAQEPPQDAEFESLADGEEEGMDEEDEDDSLEDGEEPQRAAS